MLELFVFVSGYVFAITLNKDGVTFKNVLILKFKRLIVPSIIFSILYFIVLGDKNSSILKTIYEIVNGYGHFWFLPMLFWTMLFCYALDKIKLAESAKMLIVLSLPALSILPIPLRVGEAFYYIAFFYAGISVYRSRAKLLKFINNKMLVGLAILFCCVFWVRTFVELLHPSFEPNSMIVKGLYAEINLYVRFAIAAIGVMFVYALTNKFVARNHFKAPSWLNEINGECFGIYVFQQFILQILYYKTSLSMDVGPYWLPWIGLATALVGSYILSKFVRLFKFGRAIL